VVPASGHGALPGSSARRRPPSRSRCVAKVTA
jgi:hypothetical protein